MRHPQAIPSRILALALTLLLIAAACSSGDAEDGAPGTTPSPTARAGTGTPSPTPSPTATPTAAQGPVAAFAGYGLALEQGSFWTYRWEHTDGSCDQRRGCSSSTDEGEFNLALGTPRTIGGVTAYEIVVSGDSVSRADRDRPRDFAPRWRYFGVDGNRIVASNGAGLTTIFDGDTGAWAGSGYFTERFEADELVQASASQIGSGSDFAAWQGFRTGAVARVGRASSQSVCEVIAGERICPREEAFSASEAEHYREGVGPVAYEFDFTFSSSGGSFFSSSSTKERLALVASSLRGDAMPTPTPTATPPPSDVDEREPNDSTAQAQQLHVGQTLHGGIGAGDAFGGPEVRATIDGEALVLQAEDHYTFGLARSGAVTVTLSLSASAGVGLVVWDDASGEVVGLAYTPQATQSSISATLAAGTYRVGVIAFDALRGRVSYALSIEAA